MSAERSRTNLDRLFRSESFKAVASLARAFNDFERAEDAVQDAYVRALEQWRDRGIPDRPEAWIYKTARNFAIDRLRREKNASEKYRILARLQDLANADTPFEEGQMDDRLAMIFTATHPALSEDTRIVLTLRFAAGLTVGEIASALLVAETAVAQRLVRAKRKIRDAHIPFTVPASSALPERLEDVLRILYLIFNEGYASSTHANRLRVELCDEALRLAGTLELLMPSEPEVGGLRALMLFHDARRSTRADENEVPVLLQDQDRTKWDTRKILEGVNVLERALRHNGVGPYQIEAALAGEHARAQRWEDTNWFAIRAWYDRLLAIAPSAIVALNRAVAIAYTDGNACGLAAMDALEANGGLELYAPFYGARAELLARLERSEEAAGQYRKAMDLTRSAAERRHFESRLQKLSCG
ncbi:MAG: sigma-70 family RNA polymerase sigma factor [Candidatus Eremiobacteraeota bacterium]|nr:sigma-70 family RNA polymerase sigma factor [Candidatus Eremiobacteraeota bacterium]